MDPIIGWLLEHYPTIALIVLVAIFVGFVTYKFAKLHSRFVSHESKIISLPCDNHKEQIKEIQRSNNTINDIKESVRKIEEYIIRNDSQAIDSLLRKCSPYKITYLGDVLLNDSKGKDCVDENIDFFIQEIEKLNPLVALDVEQYSLSVLNSNLKDHMFNEIKNFIYNVPDPMRLIDEDGVTKELSIKIEDILMVMSIYLRDKYFERHKEIDISKFFEKKKPQ